MTDTAWIDAALTSARPQALGALLRYFRDLDTAEEAFQNACLRALKSWPQNGPPRDAAAWLIMVGRNVAIDELRRGNKQNAAARRTRRSPTSMTPRTRWPSGSTARITATTFCGCCSSAAIPICRRPSRSRLPCASSLASRVKQIARAFLVGEAAMEQRITRAKARVAEAGVPFETPGAVERSRAPRRGGRDDLSDFQRGLFGRRRHRRDSQHPVRGGDPAGAAAAAAVPERAGDHGADRAIAVAARPQPRRASTPTARWCCWTTRTVACGIRS